MMGKRKKISKSLSVSKDDYSSSTKDSNGRSSPKLTDLCEPTSTHAEKFQMKDVECNGNLPVSLPPDQLQSESGSGCKILVERNRKRAKRTTPTSSQSQSAATALSLTLTCAYCTYECAHEIQMKRHLVRCHPDMFFLSERNSLSSWKNEHFKKILMEIIFPKFIVTSEISISCRCSVCGVKYSENKRCLSLRIHLIESHLQEVKEYGTT